MATPQRTSVYDQIRPHLDASDLIRRLGIQESKRIGSEAYCKPLCHESSGGESLQINLHTGRWNCKACQHTGVRGDLVQLVEYVRTGGRAPTHGEAQKHSPAHRDAIQWLCHQFGIPFESHHIRSDVGVDALHMVAMTAHAYLLTQPKILEWIQNQWGFDKGVVESYGIGFLPSPLLPELVHESQQSGSREGFVASGLGYYSPDQKWHTRFEGRVTFPYLENGRAVYLIGRATPWTPLLDNGSKPPKYHKLSVHSDSKPYISERITNDHLYNEPVMAQAESVVIAEGVADAVALSALGLPVVSPVTISINAVDLERFTRKARETHISRVEILFDNELSGSGNFAARRVGLQLVERGLVTKIITLPLGPEQLQSRDEVVKVLGLEIFNELERSDPRERKDIIERSVPDPNQRVWLQKNVATSKIDAAEWCAKMGASAAGALAEIRRTGVDVVELEIEDVVAAGIDAAEDASMRASRFNAVIDLAAHIEDSLARNAYAGKIAKAAGTGVTKAEIVSRMSTARKDVVKPARDAAKKEADRKSPTATEIEFVVLPPEAPHSQPKPVPAPAAPRMPGSPPPVPVPVAPGQSEDVDPHRRYENCRQQVAQGLDAKYSPERIGHFVCQTITESMGFTAFRTPDEMYLVRANERVQVGVDHPTAKFETLLFMASGLSTKKSQHRVYIAAVIYFLDRVSKPTDAVSWCHVDKDGATYFPTGDDLGRILKIEPGIVTKTRMAECKVPAVPGKDFVPFNYVDEHGGVEMAMDIFRWTSLSPAHRLIQIFWTVCLPIAPVTGEVCVIRIEGGSGSGKTRTVDAISYLVNGCLASSVPTAAALTSRLSTEMLTIDDNRESRDVTEEFLRTLLQATHFGAREKRKGSSDTGTVIERVCGALIMNGIEPIHDGKTEVASRIITLRCDPRQRAIDSPASQRVLAESILAIRDPFWSDSIRRCAAALLLDKTYGEELGRQIEEIFGVTKIGRLSIWLRRMYLAWCAGIAPDKLGDGLDVLAPEWRAAFLEIAQGSLESLLKEELAVSAVRYAFSFGASIAKGKDGGAFANTITKTAFDGKYYCGAEGDAYLGPISATQLARIIREAGKTMNAPAQLTQHLRAGQLEQRILDGLGLLAAAGYPTQVTFTGDGIPRFRFGHIEKPGPASAGYVDPMDQAGGGTGTGGGDTW